MTPKQFQFVRELVQGNSQAGAYRAAYNVSQMNDNTIRREASRLMKNPNVTTMVKQMQDQADAVVIQRCVATKQEVLETLTNCMHKAEPGDSVRVRAAELMGKHYGLFTEKVVSDTEYLSPEELTERIRQKLEKLINEDGHLFMNPPSKKLDAPVNQFTKIESDF